MLEAEEEVIQGRQVQKEALKISEGVDPEATEEVI